jgi:hypothetical protein
MMSTANHDYSPTRGGDMFNQFDQDQLVRDHIAALRAEAAEERFAHSRRAQPGDAPPGYGRPGIRGAFGRGLIALGRAIAATSRDEAKARSDAGRAA